MLALRPHLTELDGDADVRRILRLCVADVVSMVGGTEVGLVHAFEHGHRGSLERVVMDVFERLRARVENGLGLELGQEHGFLKGAFSVLPFLGSSWLHLFFYLLYASSTAASQCYYKGINHFGIIYSRLFLKELQLTLSKIVPWIAFAR